MSKYKDLFLSESRDHLGRAAVELRRLGEGDRGEVVHDLFRHAHSLKGMASSMGYAEIAELAHRVEDVLDLVRAGRLEPATEVLDLLQRGFDGLETQVDELEARDRPPPAGLDLLEELRGRAAGETTESPSAADAPAPGAPGTAPSPADGPVLLLEIVYHPQTLLPAARALIALKQLAGHGRILDCSPSRDEIEAGRFAGRLRVRLDTALSPVDLRRIAEGFVDVQSTSVRSEADAARKARPGTASRPSLPGTIRVRTGLLDRLLELVGELIVQRGRLEARLGETTSLAVREEIDRMGSRVSDLFETVMDLRLLPFETVSHRLERSVRELARTLGKRVALEIEGKDVGLDRSLLEEMVDPLQHILRNALDHGLETPEERLAAGKPETGRLCLSLVRRGDAVSLSVRDDGRGMDAEAIRRTAVEHGILTAEDLEAMDASEVLLLVTHPGFSTAAAVTAVSGRGVGMDVVRSRIEGLGGRLRLESRPGEGTGVHLTLPLSLTLVDAFLVTAGSRPYVIPVSTVARTLELEPAAVQFRRGRPHMVLDEEALPLFDLEGLLSGDREDEAAYGTARPMILFQDGDRRAGVVVDAIHGNRPVVIKPLGHPLELVPDFSGATVLDDGDVALILDLPNLVRPLRQMAGGR